MSNPETSQQASPEKSESDTNDRRKLTAAPAGYTIIALLLLLLALVANWRKIDSGAVLFHLKAGQVISDTGRVPNRDIFSAAASVEPWAYIEWIWGLALALAYVPAEWLGVSVLNVALATIYALLTLIRNRRHGSRLFESIIITVGLLVALIPVLQPTPLIAVLPLFVLSMMLVEARRLWPLVILPPIIAVWANMQVAFLLPLVAIILRLFVPEPDVMARGNSAKPKVYLGVIIGAGILCAFMTPHSMNIVGATCSRLSAAVSSFVDNPVAHLADQSYVIRLLMAIVFVVLAVSGRALLVRWQIAMTMILGLLALTVAPEAINFLLAFVSAPAARGLSTLLARTLTVSPVRHLASVALLILCVGLFPVVLLTGDLSARSWGSGIRSDVFPETAAGRLATIPLRGSILNQPEDGNYLIWRLWPGWKVCSDERATLYDGDSRRQYENIWKGAAGWQALFSLWRVHAVLGDNDTARRNPEQNLYYELAASPDWVAVYWDRDSILYVEENINLSSTNLTPFRHLKPGISWSAMKARIQNPHQWNELGADLRRALLDDPTNALAREFLRRTEKEINLK